MAPVYVWTIMAAAATLSGTTAQRLKPGAQWLLLVCVASLAVGILAAQFGLPPQDRMNGYIFLALCFLTGMGLIAVLLGRRRR